MKKYFCAEKMPVFIQFFIALVLFTLVTRFHEITSFSLLIVAMLEFVIILEVVRMIVGYLFSDENRVKLRFMIDSTIVFFIRDIMLIVNEKFDVYKIGGMLGIIAILFIFRGITMKYSPSNIEVEYRRRAEDHWADK